MIDYCERPINRFSQLLRCEVALYFISTWDINDLTFNYYWKQLQLYPSDVTYVSRMCLCVYRSSFVLDCHALILAAFHDHRIESCRLQNSPYFCVFKYARAVKQKVWNKGENRERDWGETLKIRTVRYAYLLNIFHTERSWHAYWFSLVGMISLMQEHFLSWPFTNVKLLEINHRVYKIHKEGGVVNRFLTARRPFRTPWSGRTHYMENGQSVFFRSLWGSRASRA